MPTAATEEMQQALMTQLENVNETLSALQDTLLAIVVTTGFIAIVAAFLIAFMLTKGRE